MQQLEAAPPALWMDRDYTLRVAMGRFVWSVDELHEVSGALVGIGERHRLCHEGRVDGFPDHQYYPLTVERFLMHSPPLFEVTPGLSALAIVALVLKYGYDFVKNYGTIRPGVVQLKQDLMPLLRSVRNMTDDLLDLVASVAAACELYLWSRLTGGIDELRDRSQSIRKALRGPDEGEPLYLELEELSSGT